MEGCYICFSGFSRGNNGFETWVWGDTWVRVWVWERETCGRGFGGIYGSVN